MGWIDDLVNKGVEAAKQAGVSDEKINYITCKYPYELDWEWPIVGPPQSMHWVPWECMEPDCYSTMWVPCSHWRFRDWSAPAPVEVTKFDDGTESIVGDTSNILIGRHYKNAQTGEEIWTVTPLESGYAPGEEYSRETFLAKYGHLFTLAKPPADIPISSEVGDETVLNPGPPPGIEVGEFVPDPEISGGGFYKPKPSANLAPPSKAGMGWIAGLFVGGLLILTAVLVTGKRKRGKGRKRGKTRSRRR